MSAVAKLGKGRSRPLIVTFYSFKGGVGRTLALVNVAFALANRGKRVVLIDFDLEAPGLDAFPNFKSKEPIPGFLEYVEGYLATGILPDLKDYLHLLSEPQLEGQIWLMYAGRFDETYSERLGQINWTELYTKHDGYLFFETLKTKLHDLISPDYILIDARTGESDTVGIATVHLPDVVILMYGLDHQNLRGAHAMANAIRNNRVEKYLKVLPVACRVPAGPSHLSRQRERLAEAERLGLSPVVVLPAEPALAFGEAILTGPQRRQGDGNLKQLSGLRTRYQELASEIIRAKVDDEDNSLDGAQAAFSQGNIDRAFELYSRTVHDRPTARSWFGFGTFLLAIRRNDDAMRAFEEARVLRPGWRAPLLKLAQTEIAIHRIDEALRHLDEYLSVGEPDFEDLVGIAVSLYRAERLSEAEKLVRICVDAADLSVRLSARHELAKLLLATDRAGEAVRVFESSFPLEPQILREPAWRYNYAEALLRSGRPEAREMFRSFLEIADPLVLQGQQESSISEAIQYRANFAQAIGHACDLVGQSDRAREFFHHAIRLAAQVKEDQKVFSTFSYRFEKRDIFIGQTEHEIHSDPR